MAYKSIAHLELIFWAPFVSSFDLNNLSHAAEERHTVNKEWFIYLYE